MRSSSLAQAILALFMTSDRAESIAGDLTEDRARHGIVWFWFHVCRSALGVAWRELWRSPFASLRLAMASIAPIVAFGFTGAAIVFLTPGFGRTLPIWLGASATWWIGALWAGSSIVLRAPRIGFAVCLALALGAETVLGVAAFGLTDQGAEAIWPFSIHASAMFAFLPFLIGAALTCQRAPAVIVNPKVSND